jgi:hypothetical protein
MGGGETLGMDEPQVGATNTLIGKFKFIVHLFSLSYLCGKGTFWKILYYYIQSRRLLIRRGWNRLFWVGP